MIIKGKPGPHDSKSLLLLVLCCGCFTHLEQFLPPPASLFLLICLDFHYNCITKPGCRSLICNYKDMCLLAFDFWRFGLSAEVYSVSNLDMFAVRCRRRVPGHAVLTVSWGGED